jgi:hypothetical protein
MNEFLVLTRAIHFGAVLWLSCGRLYGNACLGR